MLGRGRVAQDASPTLSLGFGGEEWGTPRPNIGLRRWWGGVRAGGQWILPMAGRSVLVALLLVYCAYRCLLSCVF